MDELRPALKALYAFCVSVVVGLGFLAVLAFGITATEAICRVMVRACQFLGVHIPPIVDTAFTVILSAMFILFALCAARLHLRHMVEIINQPPLDFEGTDEPKPED